MKSSSMGIVSTISMVQFWKGNPPSFIKDKILKAAMIKSSPRLNSESINANNIPRPASLWIKKTFINLPLLGCTTFMDQRDKNANTLSSILAQRKKTDSVLTPSSTLIQIIILHLPETILIYYFGSFSASN